MDKDVADQYVLATKALSEALDEMDLGRALEALEERERLLKALGGCSAADVLSQDRILSLMEMDSAIHQRLLGMRDELLHELENLGRMARWAQRVRGFCLQHSVQSRIEISG